MNTITKTIATLSIALSALAGSAHAQEAVSKEVNLSGYDLTSPAGVAKAKQRVRSAAGQVCGLTENEGLAAMSQKKACFRHAVEVASVQIDARVAIATSQKSALSVR